MTDISAAEIARLRAAHPLAFRDPPAVIWRRRLVGGALALLVAWCLYAFDASPARLWQGVERFGRVASFMFPPHLYPTLEGWMEPIEAIAETVAMAFLGTVLAAVAAFPLAFFGAKTINRWEWARVFMRRGFDTVRAFETLILALIFIRAFGLGPLAGILAIAVADTGVLAKLFAEALENVSEKPVEGVRAAGGSTAQNVRFAVLPQVAPVMISNALYHLESNTRSSTILGVVGAGGVGFMLYDRIGANNWPEVWTIIIMIIATVYLIDALSARLRHRLIGETAR